MSGKVKKGPEIPEMPSAWQSRAFFAAMLKAVRGDDAGAAQILRDIAMSLEDEFASKGR